MENPQQHPKGQIIEDRADQTEGEHEFPDKGNIPAPGKIHHLHVHCIRGDRHLGKVRHQVGKQDLLGQQRQKGQEEGGAGHAKHVAEIGASA